MDKLPTTSYAVMGLLSWGPRSAYDLAALAERSIANFWNIAKSQVYGEAERLEDLGLIESTAVEQQGRPDKKILELTQKGQQALDEWLVSSEVEPDRFRSAFLVKVMFGHRMPPDALEQLLHEHRDGCAENERQLSQVVEAISPHEEFAYAGATARLGLMINRAVQQWADQTLKEVETRRS